MGRRVDFYSISFVNDDGVATSYPVKVFFEALNEQILQGKEKGVKKVRRVGEYFIKLFSYYYSHNRKQLVIPFGKLKTNKPYRSNENDQLEEIPDRLYDINSLGFDADYSAILFTTNKEGPTVANVEEYLNTFIPSNMNLSLKIEPIVYNTGIEKVRNASLVKSITLSLDLGCSLNNFFLNEINLNKNKALINAFYTMAESAKNDGNSKTLALTLGLGKHGKKGDTLNLDSMLYLLEHINIGEGFVREIEVKYKDGSSENVDKAKLKNTNMLLSYPCKCEKTQVSPEDLLNNINNAVADKVLMITRHLREHHSNINTYNGNAIEIVKKWDDGAE